MRGKLTTGLILFVTGVILQEVSYVTDIWIIRFLGGILWPVGMVMGINTLISLDHKKQSNDSSHQLTKKEDK